MIFLSYHPENYKSFSLILFVHSNDAPLFSSFQNTFEWMNNKKLECNICIREKMYKTQTKHHKMLATV